MRRVIKAPRAAWPIVLALLAAGVAGGEEPVASPGPARAAAPTPAPEARLRERLSGARLEGSWRMTSTDPEADGSLSEPRDEVYTIGEVLHLDGDRWMITARIRYADRDATIPVPVRIVWAGDTPVITLDDLELPLLGKYTARVMVYGDYYSGVWLGAGHGGVMAGRVIAAGAENPQDATTASPEPHPGPAASPTPAP